MVLAIANRSIGPPWSIWGDQQDSIQQRDTGCIQLYVETAQEALDTILQAFKIAQDPRVFAPVLVCLDGFHVSHTQELVDIPDPADVDGFLPSFKAPALLDPDEPMSLAIGASGKQYTIWRFEQFQGLQAAETVIEEVDKEFGKIFGRHYGGPVDTYKCEDADLIIVIMGSFAGIARDAADSMRHGGIKAGVLRLRAFRPFPEKAVRDCMSSAKSVVVIDRDCSYGNDGVVSSEVRAALYDLHPCPSVIDFIGGLGGSDIIAEEIEAVAQEAVKATPAGEHKVVFQHMEGDK